MVTVRNSLVVQWLGLRAFTAGAPVQSLIRELRSRKPFDVAKKQKKNPKTQGNSLNKLAARIERMTGECCALKTSCLGTIWAVGLPPSFLLTH